MLKRLAIGLFLMLSLMAAAIWFDTAIADETPVHSYTRRFALALEAGINMISMPLEVKKIDDQAIVSNFRASDLATAIGTSWVIRFDQLDGRFKAYIPEASTEEMNFALESGKGYLVNVTETTTIDLEGMPWGTPIFEQSSAAPAVKPASPWAFVVSGQLAVSLPLTEQSKVVVTNLRMDTSALATTTIGQNGQPYYSAVFVDPDRKPLVNSGDDYRVTLLDPRTDPIHQQFQVEAVDLSTAHLKADTHFSVLVPQTTSLGQNYPNPFNPETWIPFQLHQSATVSVLIYNAAGKKVRQMDIGFRIAGSYHSMGRAVYWNGKTDLGEIVSSGVYFYTLQAGDFTSTRRLVILK